MGGKRTECPKCHSKQTKHEIVALIDVERDDCEAIELVVCQKCNYDWEFKEP